MPETIEAAARAAQPPGVRGLPHLISRLYRGALPRTRACMLAALMRPLGSLGLAAVASGAFAGFVAQRRGGALESGFEPRLDEVARITSEQVFELSHFVEQVDPEVLRRLASELIASPTGITAFGVAVALLVLRLPGPEGGGSTRRRT